MRKTEISNHFSVKCIVEMTIKVELLDCEFWYKRIGNCILHNRGMKAPDLLNPLRDATDNPQCLNLCLLSIFLLECNRICILRRVTTHWFASSPVKIDHNCNGSKKLSNWVRKGQTRELRTIPCWDSNDRNLRMSIRPNARGNKPILPCFKCWIIVR